MPMIVKEAYEKLKKQYPQLPEFAVLDKEFEISLIESEPQLLRQIKKKICEHADAVHELLEELLQPESTSFGNLYEAKCFEENERGQILELYKKVMLILRELDETVLVLDDNVDADFIRRATQEWPNIRKSALPFLKKLKECWTKPAGARKFFDYMG